MPEQNIVLSNAVNMSAPSQATAGGSPASRGPFGQNGVTMRLPRPTYGEHEALLAHPLSPGPINWAKEDRIDKLAIIFSRTFGPLDHYSRPSTPGPGHHHATASPNKYGVIIRRVMADKAHSEGLLAREIEKRTDAQASIQAISSLLEDGMANTMSAFRHWKQDRNAGVQIGSYVPLPLSAQPSSNFQSQDDVRYTYQQPQQADAAQCSDAFQTSALDGDPWSFQMSMPCMSNFNDQYSSWLCSKCNHPHPCFTLDGWRHQYKRQ